MAFSSLFLPGHHKCLPVGLFCVALVASLVPASRAETLPVYTVSQRTMPELRPLKIYVLKIDLAAPGQEIAVAVPDDPDGNGPAETALMNPKDLAKSAKLDVAVNASPWTMIPPPKEGERLNYVEGAACDVVGLVVKDGKEISAQNSGVGDFWQDQKGQWHVGALPKGQTAKQAVSGFGVILTQGVVTVGADEALHPRTAVGLDESGRHLTFVVVDGRQEGVSEGMSEGELAELMKSLGCWNALNLDGGGSSVLLEEASSETPRIVNTPSSKLRPIPVMIGLRSKD